MVVCFSVTLGLLGLPNAGTASPLGARLIFLRLCEGRSEVWLFIVVDRKVVWKERPDFQVRGCEDIEN